MKKQSKVLLFLLILGFVIAISGGILASVGFAQGGVLSIKQNRVGPFGFISWNNEKENNQISSYQSNNQANTKFIAKINVGEVNIIQGDYFHIETKSINNNDVNFNEKDGCINLEVNNRENAFVFPVNNSNEKITITIPKNIKDIDIETNVGEINIQNLIVTSLKINCDMGDINLSDIVADNIRIDANVGEIDFKGNFNHNLVINNDLGDTSVTLMNHIENYDYDLSCSLGDLNIANNNTGGINHKYKQSYNTKKLFRANVNVGELDIEFQNR